MFFKCSSASGLRVCQDSNPADASSFANLSEAVVASGFMGCWSDIPTADDDAGSAGDAGGAGTLQFSFCVAVLLFRFAIFRSCPARGRPHLLSDLLDCGKLLLEALEF